MKKPNSGLNRYSTINGKSRKAERRAGALARAEAMSKLSLEQRLAKLPKEGANRQRARYQALLEKQHEKKEEQNKQARKKERTQEAAKQLVTQQTGKE